MRQFGASMKVVIAPDKLRGTYTADEAAAALARGWREVRPRRRPRRAAARRRRRGHRRGLLRARGGEWREAHGARRARPAVHRPLRPPDRRVGGARRRRGLRGAPGGRPAAATRIGASSRGAGELIRAAIEDGALRIVIGVGGTASTDGGVGLRDGARRRARTTSSWSRRSTSRTRSSARTARRRCSGRRRVRARARSASSRSACGACTCRRPSSPARARAAGSARC